MVVLVAAAAAVAAVEIAVVVAAAAAAVVVLYFLVGLYKSTCLICTVFSIPRPNSLFKAFDIYGTLSSRASSIILYMKQNIFVHILLFMRSSDQMFLALLSVFTFVKECP